MIIVGGDFNTTLDAGYRGDSLVDFCNYFELPIANSSSVDSVCDNWTFES